MTIGVGVTEDLETRNHLLMSKYETSKRGIESAKSSIAVLSDVRLNKEPRDVREAKISKLKRQIKRDERLIEHIDKELDELRERMNLARDAKIRAEGNIYPGVTVKIDDRQLALTEVKSKVEYYRAGIGEDISVRSFLG